MITLPFTRRVVKTESFLKLIDALKDKHVSARIRIVSPYTEHTNAFLKVVWSAEAGILLQDEHDKEFIAVEHINAIESFEVSRPILNYKARRSYFL
jgi:hypothetical protein